MDLGPILMIRPAVELASSEFTDRDSESSVPNLLAQAIPPGVVELFGTVHAEAVGWPSQQSAKHGHGRCVGSEASVNMLDLPARSSSPAARMPRTSK